MAKRYYISNENKAKVSKILKGVKKRNKGNRPLLGLNNKIVYHPTAYCTLHSVYLLTDDIKERECHHKFCKHLDFLSGQEAKDGVKNYDMRYFEP